MNPRQRRGVTFMLFAGLTAIVMFVVAVNYISSVNAKISPTIKVYKASMEIEAYSAIEPGQLEAVNVPRKWAAQSAETDLSRLVGHRVSFNVAAGTFVGDDMLLPASSLNEDEREIALTVDAKTGIAGRIRSGDFVDVYAVFGDSAQAGTSKVLVRSVRVVSVRGIETRTETTTKDDLQQQQVIPVTLALKPQDALDVTYADAFATTVRLVGLPPGSNAKNRSGEPNQVNGKDLQIPAGQN